MTLLYLKFWTNFFMILKYIILWKEVISVSYTHLKPNEIFRTPDFYFTYSFKGKGQASRNFHDWARKYQVKDGNQPRMNLLNHWEATSFDFDEAKLVKLMDDAVELGVDMFLLDDGWFANKYPRSGCPVSYTHLDVYKRQDEGWGGRCTAELPVGK